MTEQFPEGTAIVYCQGAFNTTNGKTAHGLVRRTRRYRIGAVVDRKHAGRDAGEVLDGRANGVPIFATVEHAASSLREAQRAATHLVIGLAPDGGRLPAEARADVLLAIRLGLSVDSGLHDFLSEDSEIAAAAAARGVHLRDVRKPPPRSELHFWSGAIAEVDCLRVALLGTDSAVGKRTTAWLLIDALEAAGHAAELVGTGQTAWMQGVRHGIILDSLINDFLSGEIEHAVWEAWHDERPEVIVVEGQGSLLNPAYPGGYEILAAARPHCIVLQHAPARRDYDGFPGYPMHPVETQIAAIELISSKPVVAIAVNHETLDEDALAAAIEDLGQRTGLPVVAPLRQGCDALVAAVLGAPR